MADSIRRVRINGLGPPYTPTQISTWFFLPLLVLEFLFFISPVLPLQASIPCTIFFCCFVGSSTYYAYMTMYIDPSDPRLLHANEVNNNNTDNDNNANASGNSNGLSSRHRWSPEEPTRQCWICDVRVGEQSMHCKFCNKCVDHFDHHCMWLNTCVGKANYPYFFRTMVSISIMLFIQAAIHIALILDIYLGNGASKTRAEDWFGVNTTIPVVVVMGIFLLFNLISLSLLGQLLVFHLKLQRDGLSTYQFIVADNQRRRERTRHENDLRLRRRMAIQEAKDDKNKVLVFKLEIGRWLREKCGLAWCDPLQINDNNNTDDEVIPDGNGTGNNATTSSSVDMENNEDASNEA